jgi:myo-inositol-1(or 4)-monophosphatase
MGAGIVLVREAGGIVTGITGKADMLQSGTVLAGNEAIHKALLASLSAVA